LAVATAPLEIKQSSGRRTPRDAGEPRQPEEMPPMSNTDWIAGLFEAIDAMDIERFSSYLDEDCTFRFGNLPPVAGEAAVRGFVGGFFDSIAAVAHQVSESWAVPGGLVCHGTVSYTRHDETVLTVPFANVLKTRNDRIQDYMIFADVSGLHQR
jgi:hypothetical protein